MGDAVSEPGAAADPSGPPQERVIADLGPRGAGPTLVLIAGVHGNEPAGVVALERIAARLAPVESRLVGRVLALRGNLAALRARVRYVDEDLNRSFRAPNAGPFRLESPLSEQSAEHAEQRELLGAIRGAVRERDPRHEVFAIDLHTTSAPGPPSVLFGDTMRNRALARCWPMPLILGLEEEVEGSLSEYLTRAGCVAAVIEAGEHADPLASDVAESAVRVALAHTGIAGPGLIGGIDADLRRLGRVSRQAPPLLDVQYRHALSPGDGFRMLPGFANFMPVTRGQHLADDAKGPVFAQRTGRILMPLYQGKGDDGYFIARRISPLWLTVSAGLRTIRAQDVAHVLPGVRAHPQREGVLLVDTRIARLLARDVFHLLGYRRLRREGDVLIVSRRPHDRRAPTEIRI